MVFFGRDVELNICIFIIFVDGIVFFVFVFLYKVKLLIGFVFEFNNLVLFVVNR